MSKTRKNKTRKTVAEVVKSFTREDIERTAQEAAESRKLWNRSDRSFKRHSAAWNDARLSAMSDEEIDDIANDMETAKAALNAAKARTMYLEGKLRRVAVAIFRMQTDYSQYCLNNLEVIPSVEDKRHMTFVADATEV